jgi:hypothetical protein
VGGVIAWEPVPPLRARIAPLAPECEPAQLAAALAWRGRRRARAGRAEIVAEILEATVRVINVSTAACLLPASPPLRLLDGHGAELDVAPVNEPVDAPDQPGRSTFFSLGGSLSTVGGFQVRRRFADRPHALLLQPGGSAQTTLEWANWCRPVPNAIAVQLRSADDTRTLVATAPISAAAPACFDRTLPTSWTGTELQPVGPTDGTLVGEPRTLNLRLDVPKTARAGADLRFQVTLHNSDPLGDATWIVPLRPCPDYSIKLGLLGPGKEAQWTVNHQWHYALRCEALGGQLRPGEQATFEMVVNIPADARPGHSLLTWMLGGYGIEAEFWVVRP